MGLDQLMNTCSTEDSQKVIDTFAKEKMILTASKGWCSTGEVFLNASKEDAPYVNLVHPPAQHRTLWSKIGVANRPTPDSHIAWLTNLQSGQTLSPNDLLRIHWLLSQHQYSTRIWNECSHWLNLEGHWIPTKDLTYSLAKSPNVEWEHLFNSIKQETADLQRLPEDMCKQDPFSELRPLAQSIEYRFDDSIYGLPAPQKIPWLRAVGAGLRRVDLNNQAKTQHVRELAHRLATTNWQCISGLRAIPYIDNTPYGPSFQTEALWEDSQLYVEDYSSAKLAKPVALEIGRVFDNQEITDAILYCFNRALKDVLEYLEENFTLVPEEQVSPIRTTSKQADKSEVRDNDEATPTSQTDSDAMQPANEEGGDSAFHHRNGDKSEKDGREEKLTTVHRKQVKPAKPSLMERFAKLKGYTQEGPNLFFHDDGSKIKKSPKTTAVSLGTNCCHW